MTSRHRQARPESLGHVLGLAEQTRDDSAATDAEWMEEFEMRTLATAEYRELELETRRYDLADRMVDELAEDAEAADRFEGLPSRKTYHAIAGDHGATVAVILDNVDPANLVHAAARAQSVADERGSNLRHTCFVARSHDGRLAMLDRDMGAAAIRFTGSMKIRPAALCAAFGVAKLPS